MPPVFRILGPLEVRLGERVVPLGRRERALLGVLLLNAGAVVSVAQLIDGVWGEAPPSSAKHMIHEYVSRLRTALGNASLIETRVPGYVVMCDDDELDATVFSRLVGAARAAAGAGDRAEAQSLYDEALSLWRGSALAGADLEGAAQIDAARLDQDRRLVTEERIDVALALGRHAELIPELERHVRDEPLRERPRAQLMLALYRAGRQTDALERYRQGRALLVEHAGVEPGPELRRLERAILQHDPELALAPPPSPHQAESQEETPTAPLRRRGRSSIALAGAAMIALVAGAAWLATTRGSGSPVAPTHGNAIAVIDANSARLAASIPLPGTPGAIAAGDGNVWAADLDDDSLIRIVPGSGELAHTIPLGMQASGIVASGSSIFAIGARPTDSYVTVKRIDPTFDNPTLVARVPTVLAGDAGSLAIAPDDQLLVTPASGLLTRIDLKTGKHTTLADPSAPPVATAQGFGSKWIVEPDANEVIRVDANGQTPIFVGRGPSAIAIGGHGVWVASALDGTVKEIDPATNATEHTIAVGGTPSGIAVSGNDVWVANSGTGSVTRINATTGLVIAIVHVGGSPQSLTVADGKVWVTVQRRTLPDGTPTGGTLIVNRPSPLLRISLDPALVVEPNGSQIMYSACLNLVNYPDAGGIRGKRLVPDAATTLPTLSRDGRTLTFVIRDGLRFSPPSDQIVTAATFKSSFERALNGQLSKPDPPFALGYLDDVVGARAFAAGKTAHVPGIVARGNTLILNLRHADPAIPARLAGTTFCALPTDTPARPLRGAIPSAGPYYVASESQTQGIELDRNPNYHGSRPHSLQKIIIRYGMSTEQSTQQIESGAADFSMLGLPVEEQAGLARRYGPGSPAAKAGHQQYFVFPKLGVNYLALNTRRPLFANLSTRRAVNYAIDRTALARAGGDPYYPGSDQESDTYLAPGMPGYRDTQAISPRPDLARARRLVGAARGKTAILDVCELAPCPQLGRIVKHDLAAIGIHVAVRQLDLGAMFAVASNPNGNYDITLAGFGPDSMDPGDFLEQQLVGEGANYAHYHNPALDRSFAAANRLTGTRRLLAYANLATKLVLGDAPWAVFGSSRSRDFFSRRIGCVTYQPLYGIDLGALCIHSAGPR